MVTAILILVALVLVALLVVVVALVCDCPLNGLMLWPALELLCKALASVLALIFNVNNSD